MAVYTCMCASAQPYECMVTGPVAGLRLDASRSPLECAHVLGLVPVTPHTHWDLFHVFTCRPRALRPIDPPLISLVVTAVGHPSDTIGPGEGSVGLVSLAHAQCLSTLTTLTSHFTPAAAHHTHAEYDCSDAPDACDSDSWLCVMRDRCMMCVTHMLRLHVYSSSGCGAASKCDRCA